MTGPAYPHAVSSATPAGWYPDPYNAAQLRYWDGAVWTDSIAPAAGEVGSGGQGQADATQQLATTADQTDTFPGPFQGGDPNWSPAGTDQFGQPLGGGQPVGGTGPAGQVAGQGGFADQWTVPSGPPSLDSLGGGGQPGLGTTSDPGVAPWGGAVPTGAGLGDVGEWLSSIFVRLIARIGPLVVLLFAIPAVASAIVAVLGQRLLSGLVVDLDPDSDLEFEIAGFSFGLFALLVAVSILGLLAALVGRLGADHQLYAAHGGQPQSLGSSLGTALRRLPRAILWSIVLGLLVAVMVLVFTVALSAVLAVAVGDGDGDGNPVVALLVLPIGLLGLVFGAWLWTKLAFFFPALAVGPPGTNPFSASAAVSKGRFWGVFGRLLLVGVALSVLWGIFNAIFQPFFGSAAADLFQIDVSTGDLLIGGQNIDTLDEIRWADLTPGVGWFAAVAVLYSLGRSIIDAIWASAATGLYWRAGGRGEI